MKGTVVVRDNFSLTRAWICHVCRMIISLMGDRRHGQCRHHQQDDDARRTRKLAPARGGGSHSLKLHCENQPGRVGTPYKSHTLVTALTHALVVVVPSWCLSSVEMRQ